MFKSTAYMGSSLLLRTVIGIAVLVIFAHALGVRDFGFVTAVFGYASLASLLTDFGYATKTLRDISAHPERGLEAFQEALLVKFTLTCIVLALGVAALVFIHLPGLVKMSAAMLALGIFAGSVGDLSMTPCRATGRFHIELQVVSATSILYLCLAGLVFLTHGGIMSVAAAFLVSRIIYGAVALKVAFRVLHSKIAVVLRPPGWILKRMLSAGSWAMASNLSFLNTQIDSLLIAPILGLHANGIYQAGARFSGNATMFAVVIQNVMVPKIAAVHARGESTVKLELRAAAMLAGAALFIGAGFVVGGPIFVKYFLGAKFDAVNQLWLGLATLILFRFLAAAAHISMIARKLPSVRVVGELASLIVNVTAIPFFLPRLGVVAAPWLLCLGVAATSCVAVAARLTIARGGEPGFKFGVPVLAALSPRGSSQG